MVKKIFIILFIFIIGCTPKIEQHILVVMRSSPTKISPEESVYLYSKVILENIYESLVKIGPNFKIQPSLAISWKTIDSLHWEIYLRKNVFFHSNKPFTGFDVVRSFDKAKKSPIHNKLISKIKGVKIKTIILWERENMTVRITKVKNLNFVFFSDKSFKKYRTSGNKAKLKFSPTIPLR